MQDFLLNNYEWLRALHIIAVISWMAGMLYLPRLFVYHVDAEKGSVQSETFKVMERRLLKFIMTPAMIVAWVFGLSMLYANPGMMSGQGWMHAKLLLVVLMSGAHGMLAAHVRRFANDANEKDAKFFRIINEVPTVLMIAIVILAVVQPF
ncbi:MAG: protoporphyrinogen oxidase HemJ [Alphaproteobacteria bacterium]|nr:protoporphyrinogen oxidase HemJ [Alphaproteobacteria bacterium]